ncbi:Structural maintenance of chromosomes protein 6 [Borealophlyctis nickersoniae]|nr:Structural maintenance of chromosomes protein 6 [Borealophlyctis nickersoniae]
MDGEPSTPSNGVGAKRSYTAANGGSSPLQYYSKKSRLLGRRPSLASSEVSRDTAHNDEDQEMVPSTPLEEINEETPRASRSKGKAVKHRQIEEEDEEESSMDELMLTAPKTEFGDGADVGTVESVEMVNFMCHKYLQLDFGPKINFIIGNNGSGKSASLTALTVCLGGTPRGTGRASAIKDLLKEGTQVGAITVRIRNSGPDAYRHDKYGDAIIIERKITKETSQFKIKSAEGQVISTKKEELTNICEHMQIQPDNPMAILTQDTAKTFLANSDPHTKYKFFLIGTQLQQLSLHHKQIQELTEVMRTVIQTKKEAIPDMKRAVKELEKKHRALQNAEKMEQEMEMVKKQCAWAQIAEIEEDYEVCKEHVAKADRALAEVEPRSAEAAAKAEEWQKRVGEIEAEVQKLQETGNGLNEKKRQVERDRQCLDSQLRELLSEERELEGKKRMHKKNSETMAAKIAEEARKLETDTAAVRNERLAEIEKEENELKEVENELAAVRMERDGIEEQVRQAEGTKRQLDDTVNRLQYDIQQRRDNISQLEQQKGNRLFAFDRRMPEVLQVIDEYHRQGRWRGRKPLGPFGMHCKIKNPEFNTIVETLIGNTLSSFGVETQEDLRSLQGIFDRFRVRCSILKYTNRAIDFSRGLPSREFITILDVLDIDDEVVLNQLVINESIEQRVLVRTRDEGNHVTAGGYPPNVNGVYTKDCLSMGSKSGGLATNSLHPYQGAPRLGSNIDDKIREERMRLESKEAELRDTMPHVQHANEVIARLAREKQVLRGRYGRLEVELQHKQNRIRHLKENLQEEAPVNISTMADAKKFEDDQIAAIDKQFDTLERQKLNIREEEVPVRRQLAQIQKELTVVQNEFLQKKAQMDEAGTQMATYNVHHEHWEKQRDKYQKRLEQAQKELEEKEAELRTYTAKAEEYCERVPTNKPLRHYDELLRTLIARLKGHEKEHGNIDQVLAETKEKQTAYLTAKADIQAGDSLIKEISKALSIRIDQWVDFRSHIAARAKMIFSDLMAKRGYNGRISMDFTRGRLELIVKTEDHGSQRGAGGKAKEKDPKSLSGGEKSYSTVCLLLSLWEAMGTPFRALDEFDVFMDAVNRRESMKLMITNARDETSRHVQYIFITPQNMGNLDGLHGPDVKIIKMHDPERGQSQLTMGR